MNQIEAPALIYFYQLIRKTALWAASDFSSSRGIRK